MKRKTKTAKNKTKKRRNDRVDSVCERLFDDGSKERLPEFCELADTIARSFGSSLLSLEERRQAALIGIARGLETYQDGKSSEKTWLYLKGTYAVRDALRHERKRRFKDPSAKQIFDEYDIAAAPSRAAEPDDRERIAARERNVELAREALSTLDDRTREIIVAALFRGEKQKTVAERLQISPSWCSRLCKHGLIKLRVELASKIDLETL